MSKRTDDGHLIIGTLFLGSLITVLLSELATFLMPLGILVAMLILIKISEGTL